MIKFQLRTGTMRVRKRNQNQHLLLNPFFCFLIVALAPALDLVSGNENFHQLNDANLSEQISVSSEYDIQTEKATEESSSDIFSLVKNDDTTPEEELTSSTVSDNPETKDTTTVGVQSSNPNEDQHTSGKISEVNKCCNFNQRYKKGKCEDVDNNDMNVTRMRMVASELSMPMWNANLTNVSVSSPENAVLFQLKVSKPDCEWVEKIIHMDKFGHSNKTSLYGYGTLESSSLVLSTLGYLIWQDGSGFMKTLPNSEFCMDQVNETAFVALLCKPTCNEKKPCIRKCCSPDSVLDLSGQACVVSNNQWSPHLYTTVNKPVEDNLDRHHHYTYGLPNCSFTYSIASSPMDKMYTLVNGSLVTVNKGKKIVYSPDIYCIDGNAEAPPPFDPAAPPYRWTNLDQIAIICYPEDYSDEYAAQQPEDWKFLVYAICAFLSVFFLALTAIVYLILWEHQNIHGWLQFAYVDSCLVSYLILGVLQLASDAIHDYDSNLCEAMGSVLHFSFLSAFFWMTSMNFDLWWTFSGCRPLRTRSKVGEVRRFGFFALFSWGCAGVIAGTGLTLDCMYRYDAESTVTRPRFGERKCYFYGYEEQLPYLYGPLGCLLAIDLIFFLHTVYSLHKLQQDTRFATQQSSRQEKKRFLLFVKLFVVMGVLWIFEVLSWAATVYNPENRKIWDNVFIIFDIINGSQGFLIFVIFTCKRNTCRQLEAQFKKFATLLENKKNKGANQSIFDQGTSCLLVAVITVILPIVQSLRNIFSFCGRRKRTMVGKRHRSQTTTMTSTFNLEKSRKASDTSTTTNTSMSIKDPGAYELDITNLHI